MTFSVFCGYFHPRNLKTEHVCGNSRNLYTISSYDETLRARERYNSLGGPASTLRARALKIALPAIPKGHEARLAGQLKILLYLTFILRCSL